MRVTLPETDIVVTAVLRYEVGQAAGYDETRVIVAAERGNEKGHISYRSVYYDRNLDEEETYTDNPALFGGYPEGYLMEGLTSIAYGAEITPGNADEIDEKCVHEAKYEAENPDGKTYDEQKWGMRVIG